MLPFSNSLSLSEQLIYDEEDAENSRLESRVVVMEGQGLGGQLNEPCLYKPVSQCLVFGLDGSACCWRRSFNKARLVILFAFVRSYASLTAASPQA